MVSDVCCGDQRTGTADDATWQYNLTIVVADLGRTGGQAINRPGYTRPDHNEL